MRLVEAEDVRCTRTASRAAEEEVSARPTVVLPRRGVFRYHVGAKAIVADANTVLLFHPNAPYWIAHPTDDGDDCIALRFDHDVATDALGPASESAAAWILDAETQRLVHREALTIVREVDGFAREERAMSLLAILAKVRAFVPNARDGMRMERVRERLAVDLGERLSLADLARYAGLSPFHLARRFRVHAGTSLHQYRMALRLGVARARIREGADDMTRLAVDLGFATPAHFSAAFRKAFGCSPSSEPARARRA